MVVVSKKDKQEIVNKSLEECIDLLKKYRKAFLIRPTGFGKTWIGSELAKSDKVTGKKWSKVVFIVPLISIQEGIKDKYTDKLNGVNYEFITYQSLGILNKIIEKDSTLSVDEVLPALQGMDEGLFIFEEAHKFGYIGENREGANKNAKFIAKILEKFPRAYYFGSTATPYRTDGADMMYTFFEGNIVFPYTVNQAIKDGFYRKPTYIHGNCEILDGVGKELSEKIENSRTLNSYQKKEEKKKLDAEMIKYAELYGIPGLIKEGLDSTDCPKDYMRFLVFFSNHRALHARYNDVISWFKEVYPDMNVRVTVVTSGSFQDDSDDYGTAVYDLDRVEGTIDLILTINKLAMGYHDKYVTGIMLMRLTSSNIMLDQIVGRCFDMEIEHQTIIFDIVGNYDIETGALLKAGSLWGKKKNVMDKYTGALDKDCVKVIGEKKNIEEVKRLWDFDRIQHERELVWCYKNGIFDESFCASELKIDVDAWMNVVMYYSDITGEELHESV